MMNKLRYKYKLYMIYKGCTIDGFFTHFCIGLLFSFYIAFAICIALIIALSIAIKGDSKKLKKTYCYCLLERDTYCYSYI